MTLFERTVIQLLFGIYRHFAWRNRAYAVFHMENQANIIEVIRKFDDDLAQVKKTVDEALAQ